MGLPDSQANMLDRVADLVTTITLIVEHTWAADIAAAVGLVLLMRVGQGRR